MDRFEKKIGENIRDVRQEKKLSQDALAKKCGFSNTTLSSYENSRKIPSLSTIAKIAKNLDVSIERLYYGDDNNAFIISEPDEGRNIVNSVNFLWKFNVIYYYDNYHAGTYPAELCQNDAGPRGVYLLLINYETPLKRLIHSLNEFRTNEDTYLDPEAYLDMLLTSVATEINNEIASGRRR